MLPERTVAGMIPDTEPATATDLVVLRMLAAGRTEGLPESTITHIAPREASSQIRVVLDTAEDSARWQQWWIRHGASDWANHVSDTDRCRHNCVSGRWRGWTVDLVHLTDLPAPAVAA